MKMLIFTLIELYLVFKIDFIIKSDDKNKYNMYK